MPDLPNMICSECHCEFPSASSLLKHYALLIKKKYALPALYPLSFLNSLEVNSDGNKPEYNLTVLDNVTAVPTDKQTVEKDVKYECFYCFRQFGAESNLKNHLLMHTADDDKLFSCNLCDVVYTRNFTLQRHRKRVHGVEIRRTKSMPYLKPISSLRHG